VQARAHPGSIQIVLRLPLCLVAKSPPVIADRQEDFPCRQVSITAVHAASAGRMGLSMGAAVVTIEIRRIAFH